MLAVYQGMFWFGVLYAVAGFVIGHIAAIGGADAVDVPGDSGGEMDLSGGHGSHAGDGPGGDGMSVDPSPMKPIVIATFLIVFGGTGMMADHFVMGFFKVFFLAMALGFVVAVGIFKGVVVPLYRMQNTSAATRDQLIGLEALVTTPIYEDGFGTISYRFKENIYNAPAKSLTGRYIAQGERPVIVKFEGKAFIVHIAEEFSKK